MTRAELYGQRKEPSYYDTIPQRLTGCTPKSRSLAATKTVKSVAYKIDYVLDLETNQTYSLKEISELLGFTSQRTFIQTHPKRYKIVRSKKDPTPPKPEKES